MPQGPIISFVFNDSSTNLLGFIETILYKEYNQSTKPVDIKSFDNFFIETDIVKAMIFKGRRIAIIMNFTKSLSPGYKLVSGFDGGIQWFMMQSKDRIPSVCFKIKNENGNLVSFRLSIEEISIQFYLFHSKKFLKP